MDPVIKSEGDETPPDAAPAATPETPATTEETPSTTEESSTDGGNAA